METVPREKKYLLTIRDRERLEKSLEEVIKDCNDAAQAGYLSGSEQDGHHDEGFQLSKQNTEVLFAKIQQIREVIDNSQVIKPEEQNEFVNLGNGILIEYQDTLLIDTFIMSGYAGGAEEGWKKTSLKSALGKMLIGKKVGDVMDVKLPFGTRKVKILKIFYPSECLEKFKG